MKKRICAILAATLAAAVLAGCGSKASNEADKKIIVGASPSPHAEILNEAKALLEKQGYTLEIKEYNDYVQPNVALDAGDLDANYFQHQPYLDQFNEERKMELASAGMIHYEPFGIYAGKTASLDALSDGAQVAVPNDATNEARALLLLEAQGVITLKEGAGINATKLDVAENPKNIEIVEMEAAQLPRSLPDVDIAVINGNYAIGAGLKVADALAIEDANSIGATTYGNIVAVQKGHENDEKIKALVDVLKGDEIRKFIEEKYEGAVVPLS
ncbi:MAG: ABC transporter substrate-binding protein [Lachnospiraceae bacterium]|nr:ABC transporter substrate-binding protein [Lachnospiraceae bacterium]